MFHFRSWKLVVTKSVRESRVGWMTWAAYLLAAINNGISSSRLILHDDLRKVLPAPGTQLNASQGIDALDAAD